MSTRGLTGFIADGQWFATYNHFDSYPEYLGMQVLEFCKQVKNWDVLKENVLNLTLINENKDKPTQEQAQEYMAYYDNPNTEKIVLDWYWVLRNLQGSAILYAIENGNAKHMIDSHAFIEDSLFCEWAYIIDLDEMKLRVYKGWQKRPPHEGTILPQDVDRNEAGSVFDDYSYYPCRMLYAYSLYELPEFMLGVTNKFKEEYRNGTIEWA